MLKRGSASRGSLPADWPTNKAFFFWSNGLYASLVDNIK